MTLNQTIQHFRDFADLHLEVKHFLFGESSENDNVKDIDGVVMWVWVDPNAGNVNQTELTYSFQVAFMDVLNTDDNNMEDVLSDTLQISLDLIAWLDRYAESALDYSYDRASNIQPFKDRFESDYAGHVVGVRLDYPMSYDSCQIPLSSSGDLPSACDLFLGRLTTDQLSCISGSGLFSTTVNVYVNGVLNQTGTIDPLVNNTINITAS
jgi:hypothetical protein